ncbi:5,10-methylenetetrahydrofolate reductase [Candidatus Desantisbacteria bacterium CG2_30_40_21]|uniref:Methylenetetrahydrofolate reductase n=5 Tax=unclassified Candidatus Desantisiibacteriota TaxID=3106372 RepID=A0A2M7JCJ2_9BACT|nr:MAG: 5,10-methylenetetrahydrofolate reductase [Candidatus Desantisbacteria bacterium CG2_30_40_21]PIP41392.1 MAG: 5,10-methylenetetrahydrofolate reductase [Candidatus Desantisbacteria bacterium CG23_combo_of_CG06-09_8_20_14_all_40_23]PIX17111.1 MAG: 5,10-methylenetetrahydrofolate reductase [Candidatus Desantisbacteria bacterium CG_4_8_14_3_um_filter_40_12]PIY20594.1 MAG: 5,10-methylenetetrahydrofolate reductase [Candidatus Desantisbacteria bacterium CG_4_10_14_3_um_filter_40_18]PJB29688.1 MA
MSKQFKDVLASGEFVITSEIGPPKGTNIEKMLHHIEILKDKVHGMNVTDNQSSVMRLSSVAVCHIITDHGGEPILQMTCRDRNRMALQSDLLSAYVLGVRNVLCLTGDHISLGDHKGAKQVFDLDSVQLIAAVKSLEAGQDIGGNKLDGGVEFCVGATATPEADNMDSQFLKFRKKIKTGAGFFQTQAVYDMVKLKAFMEYARQSDVKILAGILVLVSAGMARYLNANVAGVTVPQELIDEMAGAEKGKALQKGMEIAARQIKQIKDEKICDGVHIMAIGKEEVVPEILSMSGV